MIMKKLFVCSCFFVLAACLFTACGSDDDENNGDFGEGDSYVVINDDGTTSNGSHYIPIDDDNFYLDYVKYTVEGTHIIVSGYNGAGLTGNVIIVPAIKYKNHLYNVLQIGEDAFKKCSNLASVTIPNSVRSIGNHAFSSCI